MMDVLSELLADLRVESTVYCRYEMSEPWALAYPPGEMAGFHLVVEGTMLVGMEGRDPLRLEAGDLVVFPHPTGHLLRGREPAAPARVNEVLSRSRDGLSLRHGGAGERAVYLCGGIRFSAGGDHPLLSALPEIIHIPRAEAAQLPWLETHMNAIACEATSGRPGAEMVMARLADVLFVQAVRAHLAALPEVAAGWPGALRDPPVARVLSAIHRQPERPWTVESLGKMAGMSRSHFAERFTRSVGEPPLSYLSRWRMHRARTLLRDGSVRMGRIARMLGYGSEAAFSTAFKRWNGMAPGEFRKSAGRRPAQDALAPAA
jgi:AraC-like DNA-binding protein